MVCLELMTLMTLDYGYATLCHVLAGLSYVL